MLFSVSRECLIPTHLSFLHSLAENNQPNTPLHKCSLAITDSPAPQENVPISPVVWTLPSSAHHPSTPPHPLSCTKPFGSQNGVSDFENITSSSDQLKTCGSKNFFLECFYINSVLFNINVHALVGNIHFNYNKDQQPSDTPPTTCTHTQLQKANKKHLETKRVAVTAKSWGPIWEEQADPQKKAERFLFLETGRKWLKLGTLAVEQLCSSPQENTVERFMNPR